MKIIHFGPETGRHIDHFSSDFLISRLALSDDIHVACMRLKPGGIVGYHPAPMPQLFAVVAGQGWVRTGDDERIAIETGQAVSWERGEHHEAGTDVGMTAIVIEGDALSVASEPPDE